MIPELIKCPFCGYKYKTDVEKIGEDGETFTVRLGLSYIKYRFDQKTPKSVFIDLACPNCKKEFEWEVRV